MSEPASAAATFAYDTSATSRQRALKVLPSSWDDVPSGPVPASVIRYFEEAIAREEARRHTRGTHHTD